VLSAQSVVVVHARLNNVPRVLSAQGRRNKPQWGGDGKMQLGSSLIEHSLAARPSDWVTFSYRRTAGWQVLLYRIKKREERKNR
jgi:hypothetical protein